MIPGITEIGFPPYATLHQAEITLEEMGERSISATVKIDGDIVPDFTGYEWSVEYNGEKFTLNTKTPQARKDDTSRCSFVDLVFTSFPISELKRYYFVELSEVQLGTMIINKFVGSLRVKAEDYIIALGRVLNFYFGDRFVIEVLSGTEMSTEIKEVELNYTYIWDALAEVYNTYGLIWRLGRNGDNYKIQIGDSEELLSSHLFQYGYSGGLSRIERQIEDAEIYNQLFGRGGEKNLPYRYFKKVDPNNPYWAGDPDACAELANVYFDRLLDINFRYYVKGWLRNTCPARQASIADYPVPATDEPAEIRAHWAYQKGLTDEKFQPVEYVEDTASIAEYGIRQGKLEDNDDIYPTIQGISIDPYGRIDEVVAVSEITDGDDGGSEGGVKRQDLSDVKRTVENHGDTSTPNTNTITLYSPSFMVDRGYLGQASWSLYVSEEQMTGVPEWDLAVFTAQVKSVEAIDVATQKSYPVGHIPGGAAYQLKITLEYNTVAPNLTHTGGLWYKREIGVTNLRITSTLLPESEDNPYVFNIWIKNVFRDTQGVDETDLEYAERVWLPILGDRMGNEAKVIFSDGWMSASSDYEFTIVQIPSVDRSKTLNGVQSEWKLTLQKSDAEMEATGKAIPNATSPKPVAGDHFFFTGIDMPYIYVTWAEQRVNEAKQKALTERAYANPTWAIQMDKVRIHTLEGTETQTLMSQLAPGKVLRIYDPRFTGGNELRLAIRTMTITWSEGTVMKPEVSVVLSENVLSTARASVVLSPSAINARVSDAVQTAVRTAFIAMGAPATQYLSKQEADTAKGEIALSQGATFGDYAEGLAGFGAHIDADGDAELKSLVLRQFLEVPELRFNRVDVQIGNKWNAPGGGIIERVEPDEGLNTGTIYLHLEDGEIANVALDDICMGIYHDGINESSNAVADADDSLGNFKFAGFFTTYFRITQLLAKDGHIFRYALRPVSENWTETHHPCAAMHFVGYGNFSDTTRQTSRYSTRTYERYLKGVDDWEFTAANIGAQFGDLSNLTAFGLTMTGYSAYLNNIYMTGYIKQTSGVTPRVEIDNNGRDSLNVGDYATLTAAVLSGWDDITSEVVSWSIVRDSGDPAADAQWQSLGKVRYFNGSITLERSDLGDSGISTLFEIHATLPGGTNVTGRKTMLRDDSTDGQNARLLALSPASDIMVYDADGNRVSDAAVVTPTLYDGGADVTASATLWRIVTQDTQGCTATIDATTRVVTVSGMTAPNGKVTVACTYDETEYAAEVTLRKVVTGVTYEIVVTPDAISYNTTTQTASSSVVNIVIYKVSQAADGTITRTPMTSLGSARFGLYINGGTNYADNYTSAGYNYTIPSFAGNAVTIVLQDITTTPTALLARKTIPISKVQDGTQGPQGADGEVGITYRTSVWEAGKTYRCDADGPAPDGLRIIDIVYNKSIAMLNDSTLQIYQCTGTHISAAETDWQDPSKWTNINQLNLPLATPVLLANKIIADYIDVDSLDTKLLTVKNASDVIIGRMGDMSDYTVDGATAKYPFWLGGSNPASAVTRIKADGTLETTAIIAKGGTIGAFSIDSSGNLNSNIEDSSQYFRTVNIHSDKILVAGGRTGSAAAYRIVAGQDSVYNGLVTSTEFKAMSIDIHRPNISGMGGTSNINTALLLKAYNGAKNYGLKIEAGGADSCGIHITSASETASAIKYAIACEQGEFAGLRLKTAYFTTTPSSDKQPTWEDGNLVFNNTSAASVTLPSSPQNGQMIIIHHLTATTLAINGGEKEIFYMRNGTSVTSQNSTSREIGILIYSSTFGKWILHFLHL